MKKAFQIFKRDLKRLLRNPVAMVITIGVCIIPSLYAWYNIEANWDPYGNTSGVRIAVANEDRGVETELTGELNAGEQTVEKLRENDALGWEFTDAESAKEGVYRGDYYAAIIIPADFSEHLTSMLTGEFEQPEIKYYVNEKKNAIAPKVTDTGAETIEQQLNETFVATVSSTLVEEAKELGVDVDAAGARVERGALENVGDSVDALQRVRDGMADLNGTVDAAKGAATSAREALAGMDAQAPTLVEALEKGHELLGTTRSAAGEFHTALSTALGNGAAQLASASAKADGAIGSISGAVSSAKTKIDISLINFQGIIDTNNRVIADLRALNEAIMDNSAGAVSSAKTKIDISLINFQGIIDTNNRVIADLRALNEAIMDNSGDVEVFIRELERQNQGLQAAKDALQAQSDSLGRDVETVSDAGLQAAKDALQAQSDSLGRDVETVSDATSAINTAVQGSVKNMGETQAELNATVMPELSAGLDAFSNISGDLSGIVTGLTPTIEQAMGLLDQLNAMLDQTKGAIASTDKTLADLQATLQTVRTDIAALRGSEATRELADLLGMEPDKIADFMSSPVTLTTKAVYPVANYGSGVTPFYTNLALWVGGFVLIAIIKLEVDNEGVGRFTANQGYFGRWMLLVALGFIQAVIACVGDLVLCIQCEHPALFVAAGVFTSFVYVNIIYALAIAFKHIGKAIAVVLVIVQIPGSSGMYPIEMMPGFFQFVYVNIIYALAIAFKHIGKAIAVVLVIVQIPGSSGMYPIEMMPGFFQALHPLLPFTYGINAMRETIGGMYGADYLWNLGVLAVFLVLSLAVGVWLRPKLLNLNLLFDRQLSATGLMICEKDDMPRERFSVRSAVRALFDTEAYRREILERGARFERRYPRLIKAGFCMVFGLPILLFVLTATLDLDVDGKLRERFSVRSAVRALFDTEAYRREILERGARFERRYPRLIKAGFCMVFGLPILLFVLTATLDLDVDGKLVMLVLWIVAIIAADAYMIFIEYLRESLNAQARMSALPDDELREELGRTFGGSPEKGGEE